MLVDPWSYIDENTEGDGMEFKLTFKTSDSKLGLFDNFNQGDGMDIVNFVREEMGVDVPAELIKRSCSIDMKKSQLTWSLNKNKKGLIESYPLFQHFTEAEIIVPTGWFGQFIKQKVVPHYREKTRDQFWPEWPIFMFIPFLTKWMARLVRDARYDQAVAAHKDGTKKFDLEKVVVENVYNSGDIVDAWIEDGMNHYWGIDEKRHHEMMFREQACREEEERKKEEEERIKRAKAKELKLTDLKQVADFFLKAHYGITKLHETLTEDIKTITEKHKKYTTGSSRR